MLLLIIGRPAHMERPKEGLLIRLLLRGPNVKFVFLPKVGGAIHMRDG